jgi:DNA-binding response OmpR family regulator
MVDGRILYVEPDSNARQAFHRFTPSRDVIADVVATAAEAFMAVRQHRYLAFVVNAHLDEPGDGVTLLRDLATLQSGVPLFVIGESFTDGSTIIEGQRTIVALNSQSMYGRLFDLLPVAASAKVKQ